MQLHVTDLRLFYVEFISVQFYDYVFSFLQDFNDKMVKEKELKAARSLL